MRKTLLAALLVAATAMTAIPATAATAQYAGGCRFKSGPPPDGVGGAEVGQLYFTVVLHDGEDAADNPVSADVSCELVSDGVTIGATSPKHVTVAGSGRGIADMSLASDQSVVEVCTVIAGWSDGSPDTRACRPYSPTQIPPPEVIDLVVAVLDMLPG